MRPGADQGPRWLDRLARWSVGGQADSFAADPELTATGGSTRRTALRRAAGAAGALALTGPIALVDPPPAGASQLSVCIKESFKGVYDDFQKCVKSPLEELTDTTELLRIYESGPPPKYPKKAKKVIAAVKRRRDQAIKDIEFCNVLFNRERAEGELKCQKSTKPDRPPPGTEAGSKTVPGCERGFTLCVDYCCNDANAYCQGCGTPTCCRIDADCCPNEH